MLFWRFRHSITDFVLGLVRCILSLLPLTNYSQIQGLHFIVCWIFLIIIWPLSFFWFLSDTENVAKCSMGTKILAKRPTLCVFKSLPDKIKKNTSKANRILFEVHLKHSQEWNILLIYIFCIFLYSFLHFHCRQNEMYKINILIIYLRQWRKKGLKFQNQENRLKYKILGAD